MDMLKTLSQTLFVRLFTQMPGRARNQRGASALEYIILAAVLIAIIAFLATNGTVQETLEAAFDNLFDTAADKASDAAG